MNIAIRSGPDKWTLISSFADRKTVEFKTDHGKLKGVIDTLRHEDGSGNSFIFTLIGEKIISDGYYNSKTKKGYVKKN